MKRVIYSGQMKGGYCEIAFCSNKVNFGKEEYELPYMLLTIGNSTSKDVEMKYMPMGECFEWLNGAAHFPQKFSDKAIIQISQNLKKYKEDMMKAFKVTNDDYYVDLLVKNYDGYEKTARAFKIPITTAEILI